MKEYFQAVIIISAVGQLVQNIVPGREHEGYRKSLRFLCGMVLLCVISTPITEIIGAIQNGTLHSIEYSYELADDTTTDQIELLPERMWELALENTADNWRTYITEEYDIDSNNINIVFITEDDRYELKQVQVFIKNCPYTVRQIIETDLKKKMEPISVYVFGE